MVNFDPPLEQNHFFLVFGLPEGQKKKKKRKKKELLKSEKKGIFLGKVCRIIAHNIP
jgi:hypothetical protein